MAEIFQTAKVTFDINGYYEDLRKKDIEYERNNVEYKL